jgi:hypothetical protein
VTHAARCVTCVGKTRKENRERQVDENIRQKAPGGPEQQHQSATHSGAEQNRQVPAARVQANRARQFRSRHHIVNHELRGRRTDDAGKAVDHKEDHRVPHLEPAGEEEQAPSERRQHEERL